MFSCGCADTETEIGVEDDNANVPSLNLILDSFADTVFLIKLTPVSGPHEPSFPGKYASIDGMNTF